MNIEPRGTRTGACSPVLERRTRMGALRKFLGLVLILFLASAALPGCHGGNWGTGGHGGHGGH